jgi:hypothetical protein
MKESTQASIGFDSTCYLIIILSLILILVAINWYSQEEILKLVIN